MSKKLVTGLIGWLTILLFVTSSVWAAANKDKTPVNRPTTVIKPDPTWVGPVPKNINELTPGMITVEQEIQKRDRAFKAEFEYNSVYEAAAGVISGSEFFQATPLAELSPFIFDTAGTYSYYDVNANDRNPRTITISRVNKNAALDWPVSTTSALACRYWYASLWIGDSRQIGNVIKNTPSNDLTGRPGLGE